MQFEKSAVRFCKELCKSVVDTEIGKQLLRSATSVGANYIEANEALGKKDFLMRIRICRKEAKEAGYWLRVAEVENPELRRQQEMLLQESTELMKIFGAILSKSQ